MRDSRWSDTDVLLFAESSMHTREARTAMHQHTQSYIHVHRQQRHSIILVEGQSIYCWLTGIQSPFPTGPEWRNGRQLVKRPTLIVDWWDKSWGGSWGILYRNKHTIKNLSCHIALGNRSFIIVYSMYRSCICCSAFLLPKMCVSLRSNFCHSTIRSPLRCVMTFSFMCPEQITLIFLRFML